MIKLNQVAWSAKKFPSLLKKNWEEGEVKQLFQFTLLFCNNLRWDGGWLVYVQKIVMGFVDFLPCGSE